MKTLCQEPGQLSGPTVHFHRVELPTERSLATYTMHPDDRCAAECENLPQNIALPERRYLVQCVSLKITNSILMNVTRPRQDDANYDTMANLSDYNMVEDYRLISTEAYFPSVNHHEDNRGCFPSLLRVA